MATLSNLLAWVESTNKNGLGYTPESEWEMEQLALLAEQGRVIQISFHDGYRVPHIEVAARPRPLTPEQIADKLMGAAANLDPEAPVALNLRQLRVALIEAVTLAREKHVSIF